MKRVIKILFIGFLFVALASCSNEGRMNLEVDPDDSKGNSIVLSLSVKGNDTSQSSKLRSSDDGATLRGVGTEPRDKYKDIYDPALLNENVISTLNIFIFDATDNLIISFRDDKVHRINTLSTTDGAYSIKLVVPHEFVPSIENKSVKIVAVANPTGDIITGVASLAQLQAKYETYADLNTNEDARKNFLMDGATSAVSNISWGSNLVFDMTSSPIELRRALAKIRLRIADIAIKDLQNGVETLYEIVPTATDPAVDDISVKLVKYKNESSLIAGAPFTGAQLINETTYRYMPIRQFFDKLTPNSDGNYRAAFPFYSAETTWVEKSKEETHLMLRIKLRPTKYTAGDTGTYYYYRIPINYRKVMDGVPEERLNKVERNYLYDIVTTIQQLGSLDEGTPLDVESYIAIQPWPAKPDGIDGSIVQAHYLVVKETSPIMPNVATYDIEYISDLPVDIKVTKAYYEYYDKRGDYYKVVFSPTTNTFTFYKDFAETQPLTDNEITRLGLVKPDQPVGPFDDATVTWTKDKYIQDGMIKLYHEIPTNFVPFKFEFTVVQIDTMTKMPLSEKVSVTQYPPLFVTGQKSPGFDGNSYTYNSITGLYDTPTYADFRFHSPYGEESTYQGSTTSEPQKNNVFNRITTKVPSGNYFLGNPVGADGYTKTDAVSNELVSPEFIIASQYGMSNNGIPQSRTNISTISKGYYYTPFPADYGPYARPLYPSNNPYLEVDPGNAYYNRYRSYRNAEERCYNYFEGEYGMDDNYKEHYVNTSGSWTSRTVYKTFKYQGRWRVPTFAEVKLIDAIQDNSKSVTKNLMYGQQYWTAQTGQAYKFDANEASQPTGAPVRCVFDTYMLNDK
ncbi:hypothetical protein IX306_001482 [Porphyromonas levii]|uniref:fimbrial tip adhesin FimD n=1 Tax=Porphyromonas levii TaxID=28114 RepID=UPI001BA76450|nr:fimbrial protein [Porphyromonas levii]MBR8774355.1 hypothetical protein [Porphyromonas levii]